MKKVVRLTESKLKEMIVEAIQETLYESGDTKGMRYMMGRACERNFRDGDKELHYDKYEPFFDDEDFNQGRVDQENLMARMKGYTPKSHMDKGKYYFNDDGNDYIPMDPKRVKKYQEKISQTMRDRIDAYQKDKPYRNPDDIASKLAQRERYKQYRLQ